MIDGIEDPDHFGPLQLEFTDSSFLTLDEARDAESITISMEPLIFGTTVEDRANYWTQIFLNNTGFWSKLIGHTINDSDLLIDSFNEREWVCGCRLYFNSGNTLTYYNYDDDAKVSFDTDEMLSGFIDYYSLRWTRHIGG